MSRSKLGWIGTIVSLPLLVLATAVGGNQQDADVMLFVDLAPALRGLSLDDVLRGELRVRWEAEGPRIFLDALRLDPDKLPRTERSAIPSTNSGCLMVSNFDHSSRNRLGGSFFAFDQAPSTALAELTPPGVLLFDYIQARRGFAGLSVYLHDPEPLEDTVYYLDGRPFETLSFKVRGRHGRERVKVRMADARSNRRDAALDLGLLTDFIDSGRLATGWQRATIDLDLLPGNLDRSQLDKLVLLPAELGAGAVEVDDMQLCRPGHNAGPSHRPDPRVPALELQRALWVWNTSEFLTSKTSEAEFLAFLPEHEIDTVYLQLPPSFIGPVEDFDPERDAEGLRNLLLQLSRIGVSTLALDGAPEYALPEHHDVVEQTIRNVMRYNGIVEPAARFVGLHYDVEPYLLAEYSGAARWPILRNYLRLLERAHALLQSAYLVFEVAIPFWFDTVVIPPAREDDPAVLRPLSEQVIDHTDSVALMDYRTVGVGPDGTLAMADSELQYASQLGRRVVLGLETTALPDRDVYRFYDRGSPGMPAVPGDKAWVVAVQRDDEAAMYLLRGDGVRRLRQDLESREKGDSGASTVVRHWEVGVQIPVPASRITFYDLGPSALQDVIDVTRIVAGRYPAFGGIAVHYYKSYRRLLEVGDPDPADNTEDDGRVHVNRE